MGIPTTRVRLKRGEVLNGATYKISPPPLEGESIYVTVNDHEFEGQLRPVEILINSKHVKSFPWVSAMMRMLSAQLQQPGEFPAYLIHEMIETMDPEGGYFAKDHLAYDPIKGRRAEWCHSIPCQIGMVLREHAHHLGLINRKDFKVTK